MMDGRQVSARRAARPHQSVEGNVEKKKGTNRPGENLESEDLSLEDLSEPSLDSESADNVRGGATGTLLSSSGTKGESTDKKHASEIIIE